MRTHLYETITPDKDLEYSLIKSWQSMSHFVFKWSFSHILINSNHCVKKVQLRIFSGPYFPEFGQITEIYAVNSVWISENTDQKKAVFGHFSRSGWFQGF